MASLTTPHGSSAQAHLPNTVHLGEGATESREMGAITPQRDAPKVKPLAHFVAGGYVGSLPHTDLQEFANNLFLSESVE